MAWRLQTGDAQDRVASSDGTGTGTIRAGVTFVRVTSSDANNIIVLPESTSAATIGLRNGSTGYELRTSSPSTIAINGGSGSAAESAIAANTFVVCTADTDTTWLCVQTDTAGVATVVEVAAP